VVLQLTWMMADCTCATHGVAIGNVPINPKLTAGQVEQSVLPWPTSEDGAALDVGQTHTLRNVKRSSAIKTVVCQDIEVEPYML